MSHPAVVRSAAQHPFAVAPFVPFVPFVPRGGKDPRVVVLAPVVLRAAKAPSAARGPRGRTDA